MSARARIAYLTPNALFPPNRGGRIRAYHLWRAMSAYADVYPIVVGDTEGASMRGLMRLTGARLLPRRRYRTKPGDAGEGGRPHATPGLLEVLNEPIPPELYEDLAAPEALVRHCLNPARIERILQTIMRVRPQVVVLCDTSLGLIAPHVRALGVATVVSPHNLDSALYQSMAERAPTPVLKTWNSLAAQAFRAAEEIFAPCVDQLWVCSENDALRFGESLVDPSKIRLAPNVFDVEAPTPMDPESRDLVFVGQANYYPNEDAIRNLFEISRTLDARGVEHRLRIVGRVGERVRVDARAYRSVELTGYVPSVAPFVEGAAVAPIALTIGGGTRLKILEAMALARPVLSTPIGIEGIACENGVDAVVEPELAAFPDRIEELLRDRRRAERIALAGWELAKRRYSHEALLGHVGVALRDLGLDAGKPSGAVLGRNLGARIERETAYYNDLTRLLSWRALVCVTAPLEALSATLVSEPAPVSSGSTARRSCLRPCCRKRWRCGSAPGARRSSARGRRARSRARRRAC
jgi:glycosyltransferase involved in cell wall biosynthesis